MVAEESMKALRNRISYLLTQLNHVSKFSLEWQEQQVVYQSQINSLYNTNLDLRAKLVNIQKNFMNRHINELHARSRIGNSKAAYMTEYNGPSTFDNKNDIYNSEQGVDPVDILLCKESSKSDEKYSMEALGGVFTDPGARTVPNSTEAIVERLLFDTICAFNSGARETTSIGIINKDSSNGVDSARKKKKKKSELKVCVVLI